MSVRGFIHFLAGHRWEKFGGTRTAIGLFRVCTYCGIAQEGVEGRSERRRFIYWVPVTGEAARAALAKAVQS